MSTTRTLPRRNPDLNWRAYALCADNPEFWYPKPKSTKDVVQLQIDEAKAICRACPVLAQCKADIEASEGNCGKEMRHGIRAAMTPRERYNAHAMANHRRTA